MSIKRRVLAAAATMTMVGGISAVGLLPASAETPSCANNCVTGYGQEFAYGTPDLPLPGSQGFVFDVLRQGEKAGQPLILFRESNTDPAEDFTVSDQGTVAEFNTAGLVSNALAFNYGTFEAYEFEYSPYGVDSGLCAGVAQTAANGTPAVLEPCGVSSKTVWVEDTYDGDKGYYPLINGSDTNFTHPYVLHYPGNAYPTDMPRPQLNTYMLQQYSDGTTYNNEDWYLVGSL